MSDTVISPSDTIQENRTPNSLWADSWKRLKKNRGSMVSAAIILVVVLIALLAPVLAPYDFRAQNIDLVLEGPSGAHWFGTDELGRDLLSRTIYGARVSMAIAILTAIISLIIGGVYGAISGWVGGWVDNVLMRFVDILMGVPQLVLMILVKVVFDTMDIFENEELRALTSTTLALSVVGWVTLARLVRGQILQVKQMLYVEAARALGAKPFSALVKHVLPNILGPVIVMLTFQIPSNILFESFLSFIGLGLRPPYSSWGVLASNGFDVIDSYPHLVFFPGLAIFVSMLAFNLLGDGMRDAFDPKMKGR